MLSHKIVALFLICLLINFFLLLILKKTRSDEDIYWFRIRDLRISGFPEKHSSNFISGKFSKLQYFQAQSHASNLSSAIHGDWVCNFMNFICAIRAGGDKSLSFIFFPDRRQAQKSRSVFINFLMGSKQITISLPRS